MTPAVVDAAGLLLAVPAAAVLVLFRGPSGYAALLVPRATRARYRNRRVLARRGLRFYRVKITRGAQGSQRIPKWMRTVVYAADRYRCVGCHRGRLDLAPGESLQPDHCVPWVWGGLTCLWNLFTLCSRCNQSKSAWWQDRHGHAHGGRYGNKTRGLAIYRREQLIRCNPARIARGLAAMLGVYR